MSQVRYCAVSLLILGITWSPSCALIARNLRRARAVADHMAVQDLKTISTAEYMFATGDEDGDGRADYGTLPELARAKLLDEQLGAGHAHGFDYSIAVVGSGDVPRFVATASPGTPSVVWGEGHSQYGERWFAMDETGKIAHSWTGPVVLEDGRVPATSPPRPWSLTDLELPSLLLFPVGLIAAHLLGAKAAGARKTAKS
jgi:hypothetical protein